MIRCDNCKKLFKRKEMKSVKKKGEERAGLEELFETGFFLYCPKCLKLLEA